MVRSSVGKGEVGVGVCVVDDVGAAGTVQVQPGRLGRGLCFGQVLLTLTGQVLRLVLQIPLLAIRVQSVAVLVQDDHLVAQFFVPPEGEASEESGGLDGPPSPSIHAEERQRGAGMPTAHRREPRDQQRVTQQEQPLPAPFPELQGKQRLVVQEMQTPRRGKEHLARLGSQGVSPWSGEERRCVSELVKRVLQLRAGGEQQRHSHHENRSNLASRTEGHSGAMVTRHLLRRGTAGKASWVAGNETVTQSHRRDPGNTGEVKSDSAGDSVGRAECKGDLRPVGAAQSPGAERRSCWSTQRTGPATLTRMKQQVQGEVSQESSNSARLDPGCQKSPALLPPSLHVPPVAASRAAAPCVVVFVLSQALAESATSETAFYSIGNCQDCRK